MFFKKIGLEKFLSEFIYGGIDGVVTTFAVVAASEGAGFESSVVVIMGVANLLADGFSMSVGEFLSTKSEQDQYLVKKRELQSLSEQELSTLLQGVYQRKGFSEDSLLSVVRQFSFDRSLMESEILLNAELSYDQRAPISTASMTFGAFQVMGIVPLVPYICSFVWKGFAFDVFTVSVVLTAFVFVLIGVLKSVVSTRSWGVGVAETLFLGGAAAAVSYFLGDFIESVVAGF